MRCIAARRAIGPTRRRCASASPAARDSMAEAVRIGNEVETLYTNGPAGGGGAWKSARQVHRGGLHADPARPRARRRRQLRGGLTCAARTRPRPHRRQGRHLADLGHRLRSGRLRLPRRARHRRARAGAFRRHRARRRWTRYELPGLGALNFVLHDALAGGVTRSLALDPHGKCLSGCLLEMDVPDTQGSRR